MTRNSWKYTHSSNNQSSSHVNGAPLWFGTKDPEHPLAKAKTTVKPQTATPCKLEEPPNVLQATPQEIQGVMPFGYLVALHRNRSFIERGIQVHYKPSEDGVFQASLAVAHTKPRKPSDSYLSITYPFSTNPALCDQYRRFTGDRVRLGLLLEDFDTLAGDIAGKHAGLLGMTPATAFVDRITWLTHSFASEDNHHQPLSTATVPQHMPGAPILTPQRTSGRNSYAFAHVREDGGAEVEGATGGGEGTGSILAAQGQVHEDEEEEGEEEGLQQMESITLNNDLRLAGCVTWVGKSSMEVLIELSVRPAAALPWSHVGFAYFVMVMRDASVTEAVRVPPLLLETGAERMRFALGQRHMVRRRQRAEEHWRNQPPKEHEVRLIHDLAIRSAAQQQALKTSAGMSTSAQPAPHLQAAPGPMRRHAPLMWSGGGPDAAALPPVPMRHTELWSSVLMHSQDRNNFNRIFGGHLLRLAFEHAFATAAIHAGEWCDAVSADDVAFLMPVPIGVICQLRGKVVFTHGPLLRVHVEALKVEPGTTGSPVVTNTFSYSFLCRSGPVRHVVPETVVDAMEYVHGRRQQLTSHSYAAEDAEDERAATAAAAEEKSVTGGGKSEGKSDHEGKGEGVGGAGKSDGTVLGGGVVRQGDAGGRLLGPPQDHVTLPQAKLRWLDEGAAGGGPPRSKL